MRKIIYILFVFCVTGSSAQYTKPFFNTFSIVNGLPEGYVTASLQDMLGYMWFGTQNGLVRYDGYQLKQYPIPDDNGIPLIYCSIQQLHEDKEGKLWALVDKEGLYYLDRQKDAFIKVKMNNADNIIFRDYYFYKWVEDQKNNTNWFLAFDSKNNYKPCLFAFGSWQDKSVRYGSAGKASQFIPAYENADLLQDVAGEIWLAADSLVGYFDPGSGSFKTRFVLPDSTKKIKISGITADPVNKDLIWVTTYISGVDESKNPFKKKFYQVNTVTGAYKVFMQNDIDPASVKGNCRSILTDSLNRVWCATEKGISMFNPQSGTFTDYTLNLPRSLTGDRLIIGTIAADKQGNLWLGGNFKGLFHLDPVKSMVAFYSHSNEPGSLPDFGSGIIRLFYDRSGTLWISMPWRGIARMDQRKSMFNPLIIAPPSSELRGDGHQPDFHIVSKASDSIFYVKNASGLFAWDHKHNSYKKIDLNNKKVYAQISSVIAANDGLVWIGSEGSGLFCYNPLNRSVKNFRNDTKDSTSLSSDYINILKEDPNGNLWIGTGNKGLCRYNKTAKTFTRFPFIENNGSIVANNTLDDATVHSMFFDKEGILWIGTNLGGLNKLDLRTGKFISFLDLKSGFNCVINIYEDRQGRFWAGTYLSGLFLFDKKKGSKKRYSEKDGLLFNTVTGISEDNSGNIWLASARGLSKFDPEKNTFTNFPGLEVDNLSSNILFKRTDGLFQVAVANGLITFDPGKMNESSVLPLVLIESVSYVAENNKDSVVYTFGRKEVKLQYNENKISFQFVALHYANPELNQYSYRLEGYDKGWINAGILRSATYTNLSPGTYKFHIKASNSDGVWNETGASFIVVILPPWWKTWWAYCIYGFLLLAGVLAIHRFQKQRTIRIEREKTQRRELEQAREIEKAYTELKTTQSQLVQSEKMASLGELTAGIAHEIQNPLNFVNNFSDVNTELIDEMQLEMEKGNLEDAKAISNDIKENELKINHHGKRADAIVKSMLLHSRSSSGVKELTDISALADEYLRLAYHGLRAKDKSFNATMKTDFDKSIGEINVIPQDIGRVILNLITNAFYAVMEKKLQLSNGYEPTVEVSTRNFTANIEVRVKDNGNGIPQKALDKIFQPFFTTKPAGQGTGLGLSMSYDIIKSHGGELKVETKEGEGTEFWIVIPFNV